MGYASPITWCWLQSASISAGKKDVLGLREGATENTAVYKVLLADLIERGLPTDRTLLFVIDGAEALRRALTDIFGERALIQRCREHKKRNVTEALPERMAARYAAQ
jgi:putative transposase